MKKGLSIIIIMGVLLSGCATPYPIGIVYTELQMPFNAVTDEDVAYTKVGTAQAVSILGLVATGDASLRAAVRDGKISKIKYVDYSARNILGFYGEYTTTVYGD